jgi:hypothetical protein
MAFLYSFFFCIVSLAPHTHGWLGPVAELRLRGAPGTAVYKCSGNRVSFNFLGSVGSIPVKHCPMDCWGMGVYRSRLTESLCYFHLRPHVVYAIEDYSIIFFSSALSHDVRVAWLIVVPSRMLMLMLMLILMLMGVTAIDVGKFF